MVDQDQAKIDGEKKKDQAAREAAHNPSESEINAAKAKNGPVA